MSEPQKNKILESVVIRTSGGDFLAHLRMKDDGSPEFLCSKNFYGWFQIFVELEDVMEQLDGAEGTRR